MGSPRIRERDAGTRSETWDLSRSEEAGMPVTKQQALDYHLGDARERSKSRPPSHAAPSAISAWPTPRALPSPAWKSRRTPATPSSTPPRATWSRVVTNGTAVLGLGDIGGPRRQAGNGRQGGVCSSALPISTSSISSSTPTTRTKSSGPARCWSPLSAASTWKTSRRPSASTSKRRCGRRMKIPVFHDDQHGTAIISGAALLNALEIAGKDIETSRWSSTARARPASPAPSTTSAWA